MSRRRRSRLAGVDVAPPDVERLDDVRDRQAFYAPVVERVNAAACQIGRRAFIADVARAIGTKPDRSFAAMLSTWNTLGWVELQRADMVAAFDARTVADSEIVVREPDGTARATYHFVVCPERAAPVPARRVLPRGRIGSRRGTVR